MEADRFEALVVADLLGELDGDQRAELVAEIRRRGADGRADADALREALGSLGLAAAPLRPPPGLRDRVLAAVRDERDPDEGRAVDTPVTPVPAPPPDQDAGGSRGRMWIAVAVAATVAAIALGWNSLRLQGDLDTALAALASAERRADEARALRDSLATISADLSSLLDSEGVRLTATSPDAPGRGRVFVDLDTGRTVMFVDDLPLLPPDRVYQLWAITSAGTGSLGVFRIEGAGPAWIELQAANDRGGADRLILTVEEAPGAEAPTGDPILAGEP